MDTVKSRYGHIVWVLTIATIHATVAACGDDGGVRVDASGGSPDAVGAACDIGAYEVQP